MRPLDRRIRIQRRSTSIDPKYGTQSEDWVDVGDLWASIYDVAPGSTTERLVGPIETLSRLVTVEVRYQPSLTSDMRAVELDRDSRVLRIASMPIEIGRKFRTSFLAEQVAPSGEAV